MWQLPQINVTSSQAEHFSTQYNRRQPVNVDRTIETPPHSRGGTGFVRFSWVGLIGASGSPSVSRRTRWGVWSPSGCRRRSCRHRSVHGEAFWEERADRVAAAPAQPPIDQEAPDRIHFRPQQTAKCDYATACAPVISTPAEFHQLHARELRDRRRTGAAQGC